MPHRRSFAAIALLIAAIALARATPTVQPVTVAGSPAPTKPRMTAVQLLTLRSALQRREVATVRSRLRALANRQPDRSKLVDFGEIDNSPIPVLIVPEQVENLRVVIRGDHYTAMTRLGSTNVTIDGTRPTVDLPPGARLPAFEKPIVIATYKGEHGEAISDALEGVHIEQSMTGIGMSFMRFGHLYDLSLDCPDAAQGDPEAVKPDADDLARIRKQFGSAPRGPSQCTAKNIRAIAQKLEVLGGRAR